MKKRYAIILILLIILFTAFIVLNTGGTFAYYQAGVSGAVNVRTASYSGEVEVVSTTHTLVPADNEEIDEISFYVKNFTGTDQNPTAISEVYMAYNLTFSFPTWSNDCENPISYKLYSVNEITDAETEITLNNNKTADINFGSIASEKDFYKLKVYWDVTNNSVTCYAGKNGTVGIDAELKQRNE